MKPGCPSTSWIHLGVIHFHITHRTSCRPWGEEQLKCRVSLIDWSNQWEMCEARCAARASSFAVVTLCWPSIRRRPSKSCQHPPLTFFSPFLWLLLIREQQQDGAWVPQKRTVDFSIKITLLHRAETGYHGNKDKRRERTSDLWFCPDNYCNKTFIEQNSCIEFSSQWKGNITDSPNRYKKRGMNRTKKLQGQILEPQNLKNRLSFCFILQNLPVKSPSDE